MRRLATLRGKGAGDILGGPLGSPRNYVHLDEFYRRGLARGLDLHQQHERGFPHGGLVEEIHGPSRPPPHACPVPQNACLPFTPRGPVFRVRRSGM